MVRYDQLVRHYRRVVVSALLSYTLSNSSGKAIFLLVWYMQPPVAECNCVVITGGPGNRMSPRAVVRGGVLTFAAVDAADEGEYTCKALNTHGEHTARVSLFVQSMLCVCVSVYFMLWKHSSVHTLLSF